MPSHNCNFTRTRTRPPHRDNQTRRRRAGTLQRTSFDAFDEADRLTSASDPDGSYAVTFDNLGRVLTVDNNGTPGVPRVVLTSAYDVMTNRTNRTNTSTNESTEYEWDYHNRLVKVTEQTPNPPPQQEVPLKNHFETSGPYRGFPALKIPTHLNPIMVKPGSANDMISTAIADFVAANFARLGRNGDLYFVYPPDSLVSKHLWESCHNPLMSGRLTNWP